MSDLLNLKMSMNNACDLDFRKSISWKNKHPGLDYFNANEWLQFAEMHLRHHLRQKKRIDNLPGRIKFIN
jgi:hypothetical protein